MYTGTQIKGKGYMKYINNFRIKEEKEEDPQKVILLQQKK